MSDTFYNCQVEDIEKVLDQSYDKYSKNFGQFCDYLFVLVLDRCFQNRQKGIKGLFQNFQDVQPYEAILQYSINYFKRKNKEYSEMQDNQFIDNWMKTYKFNIIFQDKLNQLLNYGKTESFKEFKKFKVKDFVYNISVNCFGTVEKVYSDEEVLFHSIYGSEYKQNTNNLIDGFLQLYKYESVLNQIANKKLEGDQAVQFCKNVLGYK